MFSTNSEPDYAHLFQIEARNTSEITEMDYFPMRMGAVNSGRRPVMSL